MRNNASIVENTMSEIEREQQREICNSDIKKILIEARDREFQKIDTGLSKETVAAVKLRYDLYFEYLNEAFEALKRDSAVPVA